MIVHKNPLGSKNELADLVYNLSMSFATYDLVSLANHFEENIIWHLKGNEPIEGKENFLNALAKMKSDKAEELLIYRLVSEGNFVAVEGEMLLKNNSRFAFSDFYEINPHTRLVSRIDSFVALLKS